MREAFRRQCFYSSICSISLSNILSKSRFSRLGSVFEQLFFRGKGGNEKGARKECISRTPGRSLSGFKQGDGDGNLFRRKFSVVEKLPHPSDCRRGVFSDRQIVVQTAGNSIGLPFVDAVVHNSATIAGSDPHGLEDLQHSLHLKQRIDHRVNGNSELQNLAQTGKTIFSAVQKQLVVQSDSLFLKRAEQRVAVSVPRGRSARKTIFRRFRARSRSAMSMPSCSMSK